MMYLLEAELPDMIRNLLRGRKELRIPLKVVENRKEAEETQEHLAGLCPDLKIDLEVTAGAWFLIVSHKEAP